MGKRDNAYWLKRIEAVRPDIHADYLAGRIPSVAEARRRAGLMSARTALHEMKNAWKKATNAERKQFISWARLGSAAPGRTTGWRVVDDDLRLTAKAKKRIRTIMDRRKLRMGEVMSELGHQRRDGSLGNALRGTRVSVTMVATLEAWIGANASV